MTYRDGERIDIRNMAWFWYLMGWANLLIGILGHLPVVLGLSFLDFTIFIMLLRDSKQ